MIKRPLMPLQFSRQFFLALAGLVGLAVFSFYAYAQEDALTETDLAKTGVVRIETLPLPANIPTIDLSRPDEKKERALSAAEKKQQQLLSTIIIELNQQYQELSALQSNFYAQMLHLLENTWPRQDGIGLAQRRQSLSVIETYQDALRREMMKTVHTEKKLSGIPENSSSVLLQEARQEVPILISMQRRVYIAAFQESALLKRLTPTYHRSSSQQSLISLAKISNTKKNTQKMSWQKQWQRVEQRLLNKLPPPALNGKQKKSSTLTSFGHWQRKSPASKVSVNQEEEVLLERSLSETAFYDMLAASKDIKGFGSASGSAKGSSPTQVKQVKQRADSILEEAEQKHQKETSADKSSSKGVSSP